MSRLTRAIRTAFKDISLKTGTNSRLFSQYPYMFSPAQLIYLVECIKSLSGVPGSFVEIGCAYGATTVFLNKFMDDNDELAKRDYYAIDTFKSFIAEHADYEIIKRGKPASIRKRFHENKKAWFDKSMAVAGLKRVQAIECDATQFDLSSVAPIAFCLIDVDLYLQAYQEFARERDLPMEIVAEKLGVVRLP
jgi:O-methyltransferase